MAHSIKLTLEQIETLMLACGIAARNSTRDTERRCREVLVDLIHAKVVAEYAEADAKATREAVATYMQGKE